MKYFRLFFLLTLGLTLLTAATHALARPADVSPAAQGTATASAQATDVVNRFATLQAMQKKNKPEHFIGTISAVDAASLTLTLRDGSSVTIGLAPNTRSLAMGSDGRPGPATLAVGQAVMVRAVRAENEALTARSILVTPTKPVRAHLIGTVTAYTPGVSITIQALDGKSYTLVINGRTSILPPELTGSLAVGSRVTIVAPRDPSGGQAAALGIVIFAESQVPSK